MSLDVTKLWYSEMFLIVKMLLGDNFAWTVVGVHAYYWAKEIEFLCCFTCQISNKY